MKRLITVASLLAVANLTALGGLGVYAWSQGWLAPDRVKLAIAALRGEGEDGDLSDEDAEPAGELPKTSVALIQRNDELEERNRIELDRREREISDAWKLLETQQLAFLREREAFSEQAKRWESEAQARLKEADNSGLQRELQILSGVKAKDAKELLKQKEDADVVRVLMAMDVRKARKIVSACSKTREERLWIGRILDKLHERDATQAEALGAGS